jgi:hypothetical protein
MLRGIEALGELAVTLATDPYFPLTVLGVLVAVLFSPSCWAPICRLLPES